MEVVINSDFIKLGQFLKFIDIVSSGGEVKTFLTSNTISINNQLENRRGAKIFPGDIVVINEVEYRVTK